MSIFDGLSRPVRAAGLGLLAVAVVAAVIGGVTLVTGGDDQEPAAQQTSRSDAPGDGGQSGSPDSSDGQSPSSGNGDSGDGSDGNGSDNGNGNGGNGNGGDSDAGDNGDDGGTGDGSDGGGSGDGTGSGDGSDNRGGSGGGGDSSDGSDADGKQVAAESVGVRVYNNSTVTGLAHNAAGDLRDRGWNVVEVDNYSDGVIPASTAYFRPGTDEEPAARQLADRMGMRVEPRFDGIKDSSPGVIVIVTKDYADR